MKPNIFLKNRSGIYGIRNVVNGKVYVGRTQCFYKRCHQYIYDFRDRNIGHLNDYLFNAMTKVGIDNFEMFVLEFCTVEETVERELHWMDDLNSCDRRSGYNLRRDSSGGMITSEETSLKISQNLKRQWASGVRDQHAQKLKDNWARNPIRRVRQSAISTKIRTRYQYFVIDPTGLPAILDYQGLVKRGLQGAMSSFMRAKSDTVRVKNHMITRKLLGE